MFLVGTYYKFGFLRVDFLKPFLRELGKFTIETVRYKHFNLSVAFQKQSYQLSYIPAVSLRPTQQLYKSTYLKSAVRLFHCLNIGYENEADYFKSRIKSQRMHKQQIFQN